MYHGRPMFHEIKDIFDFFSLFCDHDLPLPMSTITIIIYFNYTQQHQKMGRSKQNCPKRRKTEDDINEDEQQKQQQQQAKEEADAIAFLQQVPQEQVDLAAAEATRIDLQRNESWIHWKNTKKEDKNDTTPTSDDIPLWLNGLGTSRPINQTDFKIFKHLHETIKAQAKERMSSWSGSIEDPRRRAFGFLPRTLGYHPEIRKRLDISMPFKTKVEDDDKKYDEDDDDVEEERRRNERAMVILNDIPDGVEQAVENLCQLFRDCLVKATAKNQNDNNDNSNNSNKDGSDESKDTTTTTTNTNTNQSLIDYLQYRNLIAVQPNLHCGRALLPVHLDHPSKDGFGIVIVTLAMTGSATIVLQDFTDRRKVAMRLREGEAYMLSCNARDACVHGVLADVGDEDRESLNLRFGLHDLDWTGGPVGDSGDNDTSLPIIPSSQVLQYWG
jgi:hypothetical protein